MRSVLVVTVLDVGETCRCKDLSDFDEGQATGWEHLPDSKAQVALTDILVSLAEN